MNHCVATPLAGRLAYVEKSCTALALVVGAVTVCGDLVEVHLRGERTGVAVGEQLCYALAVETWDVKHRPATERCRAYSTVEGRVSPTLTVRVYCHETETASADPA